MKNFGSHEESTVLANLQFCFAADIVWFLLLLIILNWLTTLQCDIPVMKIVKGRILKETNN